MALERTWLTEKEQALLSTLRAIPGGTFLRGAEVRVCRVLVSRGLAKLTDNGAMRNDAGRQDGERWWAEAIEAK